MISRECYIREEVRELPEEQRRRVEFLSKNPEIAGIEIEKVIFDGMVVSCKSNCIGTAIYIHDIKYSNSSSRIMNNKDPFYLTLEGMPGFLNSTALEETLKENFEKVDEPAPGDIITINPVFPITTSDGYEVNITHAGIYTRDVAERWLRMFEQKGIGGEFGIGDIKLDDEWTEDFFLEYYKRNKS